MADCYFPWIRAFAIKWDPIDLKARVIRLWADTTKNQEGRVLPLEGELRGLIEMQHARRLAECPWVFHRCGHPIRSFAKAWKRACLLAGCPGMLFHDLRRTAARNLRRAGLSEAQAMAITEHKTASVFRRYSIIAESDLRDAVWRAQAFLAAEKGAKCAKSVPTHGETEEERASSPLLSGRKSNRLVSARP